ncbi:hypothetical protein BH10BAC1_BH10BAC1_07680 [soil metagenome]
MQNYYLKISTKTSILNLFRCFFKIKLVEKMLVKKTQKKSINSIYGKILPPNYLYKKNSIRLVERDGIKYKLDLSDVVDHFIFWGLAEASRDTLYATIQKGMTVLDIGANMGDTALHLSKLVGETGVIIAFEPDEINFKRLTQNLILNKSQNIKLHKIGLGHENTTLKLYRVNTGNQGMNRILNSPSDYPYTEVIIQKTDDFISQNKIENVDVIKIDVEGFEFNILKGAKRLLEKFHPKLIIELDDNNLKENGSSAKELINFLENLNYIVLNADSNVAILPNFSYTNCHFDIICH